jgi:phosphate transport system permease protein
MRKRRKTGERIVYWLMRLTTYFIFSVVAYIIFDIARHGIGSISWEFLTTEPRRGGTEGGILPAIVGTVCLVTGSMAVALPLGMGGAIYLAEYAHEGRFTRTVRLAIVTLAGVPSIVYGLFGLGLFVLFLHFKASLLSGSLTLACLILPTIIVSSEEALRAVPTGLREGSLALGATKWQSIRTNVLPYSLPGMLTGSILAIGRAAGETAPIIFTAAAFFLPKLPRSAFDRVMALPFHLYVLATQHPEAAKVRPLQYGTALVLVMLVLGISLGAILLRSHFRKKYQW